MNIQIIDISKVVNSKFYFKKYNLDKKVFNKQNHFLEIRNINSSNQTKINSLLKKCESKYFFNASLNKQNSVIILGTHTELLRRLAEKNIAKEDEYSNKVENILYNYLTYSNKNVSIRDNNYSFSSSYIMGIINVTPDSFSDGGEYFSHQQALNKAIDMIDSGVDIIDFGGESTRPGAKTVDVNTEIERVVPVVKEIIRLRPNAIISIDTTKSKVAALALESGASIINDVSAFSCDREILEIVKNFNVPYILMHMKGTPRTMQNNPFYDDPVADIYDFFNKKIEILQKKGINKIIIDPGFGFGKRIDDNLELIKRLSEFKGFGLAILIGLSRKSFLGKVLDLGVNNRDIATVIAESFCVSTGATFIRTHNTKYAMQMKKIFNYKNQVEHVI